MMKKKGVQQNPDAVAAAEQQSRALAELLGRSPLPLERVVADVMWSEHCGYTHSRDLLDQLPRSGERLLQGPGENAGAVALNDEWALVFKMESHNHPSMVEPFQGAATGAGGILRDIFAMGARPALLMDGLSFGLPETPHMRYLARRVVEGLAHYGNSIGVPIGGGNLQFDHGFCGNILVNVLAAGFVRQKQLMRSSGGAAGDLLVYYGNLTGLDGLGGAGFASAELSGDRERDLFAVQIGDPYCGKRLLEATVEMIEAGIPAAVQDMGAAGLTSSTVELAASSGCGAVIELDKVPVRMAGLTPRELLLSESQERMVAAVKEEQLPRLQAVLDKWELPSAVIGRLTADNCYRVYRRGEQLTELPVKLLTTNAPQRQGPLSSVTSGGGAAPQAVHDDDRLFVDLLQHPEAVSAGFVYQQYDYRVQTDLLLPPGEGGAAVVRHKTTGIMTAFSLDGNSYYTALDARRGAQIAVCEGVRNLAVTGATPVGITDCLNAGNPEKGPGYRHLTEMAAGLADACRTFGIPVTGGNVSLYNESAAGPVLPTPAVGVAGIMPSGVEPVPAAFNEAGLHLWLLGESAAEFGGSLYTRMVSPHGWRSAGQSCPAVNLETEKQRARLVRSLAAENLLSGGCDLSRGGLLRAAAVCALNGGHGFVFDRAVAQLAPGLSGEQYWRALLWGETQGRYLLAVAPENLQRFAEIAAQSGEPLFELGQSGGLLLNWFDRVVLPLRAADGLYQGVLQQLLTGEGDA